MMTHMGGFIVFKANSTFATASRRSFQPLTPTSHQEFHGEGAVDLSKRRRMQVGEGV
jgi:hypothetical protein